MLPRKDFNALSLWLIYTISLISYVGVHVGGESLETDYLVNFILSIDPGNSLGVSSNGSVSDCHFNHPTSFKCDPKTHSITEIRLEKLNLSGRIDADLLCKLPSLQVLSLAKNRIVGVIPDSISKCVSLTHLNLSSNLLNGCVPASLNSLKNLRSLDISNNNLSGPVPKFVKDLELVYPNSIESTTTDGGSDDLGYTGKYRTELGTHENSTRISSEAPYSKRKREDLKRIYIYGPLFFVLACCVLFSVARFRNREKKSDEEKERQEIPPDSPSPIKILTSEVKEEDEVGDEQPEFIFFVKEDEQFRIEELLGSAADLQGQSFCSSLYKVTLDNNVFAVKRLKKLQVSIGAFGKMMKWVGNLKHPNLLPLVAYHSSNDDVLLIYRFQRKRSLLHLLESYADGKRDFPWRHRLSIANGIARGMDYIYRKSADQHVPHGNLKLSNILLSENEEPLISEYGFQRYIDPKKAVLYSSNGYRAPEKNLTEKGDVFSFGIILLELLTGKTIERTGLDLPKWVRSKVSEEWTGEVFDKEVNRVGNQWAFPLLNISLQCVSHLPEDRPNIAEVLGKIEEAVNGQDDHSFSSTSSIESMQRDGCLLHTVILEGLETPDSELHTVIPKGLETPDSDH